MRFQIQNTEGRQGRAWSTTYADLPDAEAAVREAMGWDDSVTSDSFAGIDGNGTERVGRCVYPTQEECDADQDGAHAPRIVGDH